MGVGFKFVHMNSSAFIDRCQGGAQLLVFSLLTMKDAHPEADLPGESKPFEVVDPEMAAVLRRKSPAERLAIGEALWEHARDLLDAHLASTHPEWSEERRRREVARRMADGSW